MSDNSRLSILACLFLPSRTSCSILWSITWHVGVNCKSSSPDPFLVGLWHVHFTIFLRRFMGTAYRADPVHPRRFGIDTDSSERDDGEIFKHQNHLPVLFMEILLCGLGFSLLLDSHVLRVLLGHELTLRYVY